MVESTLKRDGFMLVLSSPSGAGKTTLSRLLMENDNNLIMSVSCTTRTKRAGEIEGTDYFFINEADFSKKKKSGYFYEYAEVFGNFYGTPKNFVNNHLKAGRDVLFDIDWQGTGRLTREARKDIVSIFILPPSMEELKRRLISRNLDNIGTINDRMERAGEEISHWSEYDYVIINDNIDSSLQKILYILKAERLKRERQQGLSKFVSGLLKL